MEMDPQKSRVLHLQGGEKRLANFAKLVRQGQAQKLSRRQEEMSHNHVPTIFLVSVRKSYV